MHTHLAAFLVGIPLITACSDGGSAIRIHAPDQSVAVLEDGVWTDVAMNEGVGEHTPDGPFALAAICRLPAGDVRLGGVHVVLAAPGEVTETRSSCRPRPRTVAGTMEILGASAPVKVFAGGYELVQSTGSAGLPPGRQDIVAYDAFQHRLVLVRDVIIAEGFHVALDFTSPAPVAPRPRAHRLVLETRNGTTVTEYGTASDGIHAVSLSPSILVDEDRQWVIGLVSEPDPLGMHQAFVRLDVGRDAPAGGLPAWTGHTVSDARVQAEGGRMSAEWSSDGPWTTRRVRRDAGDHPAVAALSVRPGGRETSRAPRSSRPRRRASRPGARRRAR